MARIGFVGLGNMGLPMATNLFKAGHEVTGFDLVAGARDAFAAAGGEAVAELDAAIGTAEVAITMLPEGRHVSAVYLDERGVLARAAPGALLIDCSTIDVTTARLVAAAAGERGFAMVDAPVSGGVGGAAAATLTFMVGGSEAEFERARPVLAAMGKTIVHTGASGTGQAAKICNNMMLGIQMIGVCEAMALARRLDLSFDKLFEVSSRSSGQCWSLTSYCPVPGPVPGSPANRGYAPGFTADMMLKDLKLAAAAAQATSAAVPLGGTAAQLYQLFSGLGHGGLDFSAIFTMVDGVRREH
jgi:3-hydroxyisobutyrate dehydrogenase